MFKDMATDYQIRWFIFIFIRVIVNNKTDIPRDVIARLGFIAWTKTNTKVIPAVAQYSKKVSLSSADLDDSFLAQVICRDQLIG